MENKQLKQLIRLLETLVSETQSTPAKKARAKSSPIVSAPSKSSAPATKKSAKPKKTDAEKAARKEAYTAFTSQAIDFSFYQPIFKEAPADNWEIVQEGDPKYPLVINTFKNANGVRLYECSIPKWDTTFYTFHAPFSLCKFIKAQINTPVEIPFSDEQPITPAKKSKKASK